MSQANRPDRLPLRLKLLYSTGDLSVSIPLAIIMFFQMYFLNPPEDVPDDEVTVENSEESV